MKSKKCITQIFAAFTILCCFFFSACPGEIKNEDVYYTVTYETEHGTVPEAKKLLMGTVLQAADLPPLEADGYIFEGWYISTVKITTELEHKVTSDITLVAKWSVKNSGTNQGNEGQGGESQGGESQGGEGQGEQNQGTENQGEGNQGEGNQGGESQGGEGQGEQNQGGENQGQGNQGG